MNIKLIVPSIEDYWYEEKIESDPKTMNYNAGYDVSYFGYHYDTGCIDFPKDRWEIVYNKRINEKRYVAYIKDIKKDEYVGYANYHFNKNNNRHECGIVIEYKYRNQGYAETALKLLCQEAFNNGVETLYDNFEQERTGALKLFLKVGFKIVEETKWKKFDKYVDGIVVALDKKDLTNLKNSV